jgi:hypothetical protein
MTSAKFLQTIDNSMAMKNGEWLEGSSNFSIQDLPAKAGLIIPVYPYNDFI